MRARIRLELPFAVVGAAAGWLSAGFLRNPAVGLVDGDPEPRAAAIAAVMAALVGALCSRLCAVPRAEKKRTWTLWLWLTLAVCASGAATGGIIAMLDLARGRSLSAMADDPMLVASGMANGVGAAVAFLPVCVLVLAAGRRASEARHGGIVAASDRRAVWGILFTALAAAASLAALDWPFVGRPYFENIGVPGVALGVLALAEMAVLAILVADGRALARLRRPRYATGDDGAARSALHDALFRGGVGLSVIALSAAAHVVALAYARQIDPRDSAMVWSLSRALAKKLAHM